MHIIITRCLPSSTSYLFLETDIELVLEFFSVCKCLGLARLYDLTVNIMFHYTILSMTKI
jgi:hypothetical protein